ncbi:uncharacterized protein RCC_11411 [Ramularia collo-cygni]|uniref:Aminoglycoside phosphotransferase domain-containing protein n=1 Tax=Ramularia collo-cygni TaxID=112498 RepID=A0A2D3V609_9PEZI|nr:uncharacterized protein RCC_11411 [Ramularia collo-cygni]CZT25742.1 uncharacterized protein RCC_11411 [Ramularia collo-cygni]
MTHEGIIEAWRNPQRNSIYKKARLEIIKIGRLAIKFGSITAEEASNQIHAHELLDVAVCRVPRVHDYFHVDGVDYLVIEYAEGTKKKVVDDTTIDKIANIVKHLHSFTSETPGPVVKSGICRGPLWSQDELVSMNTKQDLTTYINSRLRKDSPSFVLSEDLLVFVHDWEFAGYFPRSAEIATLCMGIGEDQRDLCFSYSIEQAILRTKPLVHYEALEVQLWQSFALNHVRYYWPAEEEKAFLRNRRQENFEDP